MALLAANAERELHRIHQRSSVPLRCNPHNTVVPPDTQADPEGIPVLMICNSEALPRSCIAPHASVERVSFGRDCEPLRKRGRTDPLVLKAETKDLCSELPCPPRGQTKQLPGLAHTLDVDWQQRGHRSLGHRDRGDVADALIGAIHAPANARSWQHPCRPRGEACQSRPSSLGASFR